MSVVSDMIEEIGVPALHEHLGDTVSYSASGAAAVSIVGMFELDDADLVFEADGAGVVSRGTLRIRNDATAGIASPSAGDAVTIGGEAWYVRDTPATPSWASWHDLTVVQYAPAETSRRDHRLARGA